MDVISIFKFHSRASFEEFSELSINLVSAYDALMDVLDSRGGSAANYDAELANADRAFLEAALLFTCKFGACLSQTPEMIGYKLDDFPDCL